MSPATRRAKAPAKASTKAPVKKASSKKAAAQDSADDSEPELVTGNTESLEKSAEPKEVKENVSQGIDGPNDSASENVTLVNGENKVTEIAAHDAIEQNSENVAVEIAESAVPEPEPVVDEPSEHKSEKVTQKSTRSKRGRAEAEVEDSKRLKKDQEPQEDPKENAESKGHGAEIETPIAPPTVAVPDVAAAAAAAAAAAQRLALEIANARTQGDKKLLEHRVDVNDFRNKFLMTRMDSLKEIEQFAGVEAKAAGQFIPDRTIASDNLPLHIVIKASNQEALDRAIVKIDELKHRDLGALVEDRTRRDDKARWPEEKVAIGFDNIAGRFNVKAKIVGPEGKFVKWISQEAGLAGRMPIKVQVKGRGSGYIDTETGREADEPMYLSVSGPQTDLVQYAKELAEDLVAAVREKHSDIKQSSNPTASGNAYISEFQGAFDNNINTANQYYNYQSAPQDASAQDPEALAAYYAAYYAQGQTDPNAAQADPAAMAAYQTQLAQYYAQQGYDQATISAAMQAQNYPQV